MFMNSTQDRNCFSCFKAPRSLSSNYDDVDNAANHLNAFPETTNLQGTCENCGERGEMTTQAFTFRELAIATNNFRQECLLGEGGFGRVYKGILTSTGRVVAVKKLDRNGMQTGNKEFLSEILALSLLHHANLVNLIGYCADGDQRLLAYEFMSRGSIDGLLFDLGPDLMPLDWHTRMKIAFGTAKGLDYLHTKANPPITYRDLKPSNILLDGDHTPKLSDVGLAKLGHSGDNMHLTSRVMGTYGYCAPEYSRGGQPTLKSDVYSFGVILLELVTGRRAIDTTKPNDEQNLVSWAQPLFRDPKRYLDMADPLLNKQFPEKDLNQAVAISAMCLQDEPTTRPFMSDIVMTLSFLSVAPTIPAPLHLSGLLPSEEKGFGGDHHQQKGEGVDPSDGENPDHRNEEKAHSCDHEYTENGHQAMTDHDIEDENHTNGDGTSHLRQ